MSMFEAQLWCLAAGAIGMVFGAWVGYQHGFWKAWQKGYNEATEYALKTINLIKSNYEKNYQPKPKRDNKGKFISAAKLKQESMTAQLKREVAAKKGRLL